MPVLSARPTLDVWVDPTHGSQIPPTHLCPIVGVGGVLGIVGNKLGGIFLLLLVHEPHVHRDAARGAVADIPDNFFFQAARVAASVSKAFFTSFSVCVSRMLTRDDLYSTSSYSVDRTR